MVIPHLIAHATALRKTTVKMGGATKATVSVNVEEPAEPGTARRVLTEEEWLSELQDQEAKELFQALLLFGGELGAFPLGRTSSMAMRLPGPNGSRQGFTLDLLQLNGEGSDAFLGYQ